MTDISKLPERFLAEMKELLGDEYNDYVKSFEENWKPGLRANTLKISPEELKAMVPWPMEPVPWTGKGFTMARRMGQRKASGLPSIRPITAGFIISRSQVP